MAISHENFTTNCTGRLLDLWNISDESFRLLVSSLNLPAPSSAADEESLLSDRMTPDANYVATFDAVSTASPSVLWSWVAQAMRGAGVYGWSRLDGPGCRPSKHLLDHIPAPRVGDHLGGLLEICRVDAHHEIVWRNLCPLAFLESTITDARLDYRVERHRPEGARLTARLRCVIEAESRQIGAHGADVLAYILPYCQVNALTQYAETEGRGKRVQADISGSSFQHTALTPAGAHRRQPH